jgi:hypothetical protein
MSWMDDEMRRQMLSNDSLRKSLTLGTSIASIASAASTAAIASTASKDLLNLTAYTPPKDLLNIVAYTAPKDLLNIAVSATSKDLLSIAASTASKDLLSVSASTASTDLFKIADTSIQMVTAQPSYIQDLLSQKTVVGSLVAQPTSIDSIFQLSKTAEIAQASTFWQLNKSLFEIPNTVQLTDLARGALDRQAAYLSVSDTVTAMSRLQSSWLDTRNPLGSVSSFATIQAIGFGANHTPFEPEFMTTLRGQLGDWRDVDSTPPAIFEDAAERSKFYIARGFRTELVDFTPEALEEIVENVGLGADDEENFEWHERTYAHVIRIERKLRKHVNAVMTRAFGENWISFDGNLVDRCKATKARRLADGEPERPHLVYYAELSDLCSIMERKNHFPLFKPIFKRKEAMQETFKRVVPARHAVMHDGIVTPIDFLTVMTDHMNIHQGLRRQEEE